jgi:hypothetical protein
VSKYPIEPGTIFRLDQPIKKLNRRVGLAMDHTLYVWILGVAGKPANRQPKDRKVHTLFCYQPTPESFKEKLILRHSSVQFETIARLLKGGFETVKTGVRFNYTDYSYKRFYKEIGVI